MAWELAPKDNQGIQANQKEATVFKVLGPTS